MKSGSRAASVVPRHHHMLDSKKHGKPWSVDVPLLAQHKTPIYPDVSILSG